jgi:hypothetical protein
MRLKTEYMQMDAIKKFANNPKSHDLSGISDSIGLYGYLQPMLIDERTETLVAGHGRLESLMRLRAASAPPPKYIVVDNDGNWLVPVTRGAEFKNEEQIRDFLLTDNQLTISGGWDEEALDEILSSMDSAPIGFDNEYSKTIDDLVEKEAKQEKLEDDSFEKVSGGPPSLVTELVEDVVFESSTEYGIPDLKEDMLLEKLPTPLDTWGDRQTTPDDKKAYWLYNYGAAPSSGLPFDRAILSHYTDDVYIEKWWKNPPYHTMQMVNAGIKMAICPDFSLYENRPPVEHIMSIYKSQWFGRYFQEVGIKVIPRVEYFLDKTKPHYISSKSFSLHGIPIGAPVISTQMHTKFPPEHVPILAKGLEEIESILKPKQFLIYANARGREVVEKANLKSEVVLLPTVRDKRIKFARKAESDPAMLDLRRAKRG